jgi:hypothetical protein
MRNIPDERRLFPFWQQPRSIPKCLRTVTWENATQLRRSGRD